MGNGKPYTYFKGKQPYIISYYRPISLLSCLGKVLERCVFKYTFNYLRDYQRISMNQSGFIPGDSTVNQLVNIYHNTCASLDEHKHIQMIFLTYQKPLTKSGS